MRKKMMAGLLGAAALLAVTASSTYADWPKQTCSQGTIVSAIAGPLTPQTWPDCIRMLKMRCNDTSGSLAGKIGTYCVHRGIDPDGMWSLALLAIRMQGTVGYQIYTAHIEPQSQYGNGLLLNLSGVGIP